MFTTFTSQLDVVIKAFELALFLLLLSYVGLGFIFRIIFKILKIKLSNSKLSLADEKILDLQLIKLYHGITLEKTDDIELFAEAIASGKVEPPKTWIFPSFQIAGKRRLNKRDATAIFLLAGTLVVAMLLIGSFIAKEKYNYASFSNKNERVYVSDIYVYDPIKKNHLNRNDCIKLTQQDKEILRNACDYIITNDKNMKLELQRAIQKNNSDIHVMYSICVLLYLFFICILITYPRFQKFNNQFFDYKNEKQENAKSNTNTLDNE